MLMFKKMIKKKAAKRFSINCSNSNEEEVEELYQTIITNSKHGLSTKNLIPLTEKAFNAIIYIMLKHQKVSKDIFIIKTYWYNLSKFMNCFSDIKKNLDELIHKISSMMKCEQIWSDNLVFKQGEKGDSFFLIWKGTVSVWIQKDYLQQISKVDYLKYLITWYLYQEIEIFTKCILLNWSIYSLDERTLFLLFTLFKVYKHLKERNVITKTYGFIKEYFDENYKLTNLLEDKYESSIAVAFTILNFNESEMNKLYLWYEKEYRRIEMEIEEFVGEENDNKVKPVIDTNNSPEITTNNCDSNAMKSNTNPQGKSPVKTERRSLIELNPRENEYGDWINSKIVINNPNYHLFISHASVERYISRIIPDWEYTTNSDFHWKWYKYVEVITWNQGNIFGEIAWQNDTKKRTATIITKTECFFGTLTKQMYDNCLKTTHDKIRNSNIMYFLNGPIFHKVNRNIFESKFYNMFIYREYKHGFPFFTKNSPKTNIYFIKSGELEWNAKLTFAQINKIIMDWGGQINDKDDIKLTYINKEFKHFYNEQWHNFRICLLKNWEIAGLDDFIFNDKYFCDCVCSSSKAECFVLDLELYKNLESDKQIGSNLAAYIQLKRNFLTERLKDIRSTKIENQLRKINWVEKERYESYQNTRNSETTRMKKCSWVHPFALSVTSKKENEELLIANLPKIKPIKIRKNEIKDIQMLSPNSIAVMKESTPQKTEYKCMRALSFANKKAVSRNRNVSKIPLVNDSNMFTFSNMKITSSIMYKTHRVKTVRVPFGKTSWKEIKTKVYDNRVISDTFYLKHSNEISHAFSKTVDQNGEFRRKMKEKQEKNNEFIDLLVLDKWAEKKNLMDSSDKGC